MSMKKIEEKIVKLAHEFVKEYGTDAIKTKSDIWSKYIIPNLTSNEREIFKHNQFRLLVLFYKTIVTDLRNKK
jgi:hypothetical protein